MSERKDDTGFGNITLIQDTEQFCYGVDAVLLASFAAEFGSKGSVSCKSIADLGTNNGAVALILSFLTDADSIVGVELQKAAYELACRNVEENSLKARIAMVNCDVLDIAENFEAGSFDMVVCNPPYSAKGTSKLNKDNALTAARHETTAGLDDFVAAAAYLLKDKGSLCMVYRPSRLADLMCSCRAQLIEPRLIRFVSPRIDKKPNIMLLACKKNGRRELKFSDPLAVYNAKGEYTDEIQRIYRRKD